MDHGKKISRPLETAVVLFVYHRIEYLPEILARIREAAPPVVYVFGDGPVEDAADRVRCDEVRALVERQDWPCPAHLTFSDRNLGNSKRIVSAIEQVFAMHDQAIFLEDDTPPSASFFGFCDELLARFAAEPQVMMISGVNPFGSWRREESDYFFTTGGNAQAWATWRRAWRFFAEAAAKRRDAAVQDRIARFLDDPERAAERRRIYAGLDDPRRYVWDYEWALARQAERGLCAVPCQSLAVHRGRGALATHVSAATILDALTGLHQLGRPLRHDGRLEPDPLFDRRLFEATHDRLSPDTARWLAERLMERGRNLLALALLRHACGPRPDAETCALVRRASVRATAGSGRGAHSAEKRGPDRSL